VFAHPDDESFGTGGTLAYYAHNGCEVRLICATRGEAGEVDSILLQGYRDVAELREHELRCAAKHLGLAEVEFLGYRDSGMPGLPDNHHTNALAAQPVEVVAEKIARRIREFRPDVVITFDPNGGYKHPDHIATHRATLAAFKMAGGHSKIDDLEPFTPKRLFYSIMPTRFLRIIVKIVQFFGGDAAHVGKNKDINLKEVVQDSFPIHARINYRSVSKEREAAAACHVSQGGGAMCRGFIGWWRKVFAPYETFMQGFPPKEGKRVSKDLFEGI